MGPLVVELAENAQAGEPVVDLNDLGTNADIDEDGAELSYVIIGGDSSYFTIGEQTGLVTLTEEGAQNIDFETQAQRTLQIGVQDDTMAVPVTLTVNLTNVNEAPTVSDATATVIEGALSGTQVLAINAQDPEGDGSTTRFGMVLNLLIHTLISQSTFRAISRSAYWVKPL